LFSSTGRPGRLRTGLLTEGFLAPMLHPMHSFPSPTEEHACRTSL